MNVYVCIYTPIYVYVCVCLYTDMQACAYMYIRIIGLFTERVKEQRPE